MKYELKNGWTTEIDKDIVFKFAEGYKDFLATAKTERECVEQVIERAEKNGFVPYTFGMELKVGGKYYYNNRDKSLYLFVVGKRPIEEGVRVAAAHIDSPRIDLKQCPVYEDGGMSFFKTHYYGGIRKYQWVTLPLAFHGVVVKKDGTKETFDDSKIVNAISKSATRVLVKLSDEEIKIHEKMLEGKL